MLGTSKLALASDFVPYQARRHSGARFMEHHTVYQLLSDLASPVVTLITALIAGFITITFARNQTQIAQSQRDIALDKLKFDLFEKRYEIYQACKTLLEYVPFITDIEKSDPSKIRSLYIKLDEASFYFPPAGARHFTPSLCVRRRDRCLGG